jgi:hypothetical protein
MSLKLNTLRGIIPNKVFSSVLYPIQERLRSFHSSCTVVLMEDVKLALLSKLIGKRLRSKAVVKKHIGVVDTEWEGRIREAVSCPDNSDIPRSIDAGRVIGSTVVMHNGIKIRALGYYGGGILNLLIRNKGVHEPQEEKAFQEVLKYIPDGATMLELGAYWGFYSIWFAKSIRAAHCYLIEPDPRNIESGRQNLRLNGIKAKLFRSAVGDPKTTNLKSLKTISLDKFCKDRNIAKIDILHSDIQGAELSMIEGGVHLLEGLLIDYIFISTHTDEIHYACIARLKSFGYQILCSADLKNTYSYDGLIVAKSPSVQGPEMISISSKNTCC